MESVARTILSPLLRVIHLGASRQSDPRAARRVSITNGIALVIAMVSLQYLSTMLKLGIPWSISGALALPFLGTFVTLALNASGRFTAGRLMLLIGGLFVMVYFRFAINFRADGNIFYAWACIPLVISDVRERKLIVFGVGATVLSILFIKLWGEAHMGAPMLSAHQMASMNFTAMAMTFVVLLSAVLFFMIANHRAEQKLSAAYADVHQLLDSVDQGFVTLDKSGRLLDERSTVFDRWFATPAPGTSFADALRHLNPATGDDFEMNWSQIEDALLPVELLIDQ